MLYDLGISIRFSHAGSNFYEHGEAIHFNHIDNYIDSSVIFVLRDPRDVVMSYYKDLTLRHGVFDGSLMDMARSPGIGIDGICAFNALWVEHSENMRGFRLVRYEILSAQTEETLAGICDFLGAFWISRERIRNVVAESSFDRMRNAERSGEYRSKYPKYWFEGVEGHVAPKVRRGKVGGFVDDMPEDVRIYCDERIRISGYPEELLAIPLI